MADTIPPPPAENSLFGNTPPPPPPEEQVYGGSRSASNIPPPPSEADLYHVPARQRVNAQGQHPNALQAGIMDLTNSPVWKDMTGAFQGADLNGFGGFVARHLYSDVLGVPKDQVNAAVQSARQDAAQQQQQNAQNIPGTHIDPLAIGSSLVGGADPTLALPIPGLGKIAGKIATKGLAGMAARVGVNAAAHAEYGSLADAAYQGADILDGLQKDFDVQRNLHAAATMGALGGVGGALHEASPFVQSLFKQRNGVDTTPSENPTGLTTPLSNQGLSPTELQQYHDVLKHGNESDIHNFFDGRNAVPPSHTDIHEWVNRRDAAFVGQPYNEGATELTNRIVGTPDLRQAVSDHIAQHTQDWKNAPEYEVINHTDEIADPAVREAAVKEGADNPDALGFVGPDNKVRIFANKIDSPETLNAVLYHESLGHFGLQQAFGDRLDQTITNLMDRNVGQFGKDVDAWQKVNPGAYNGDRIRAGEEVLANMSNNGTLKPSLADALTAHVRGFGRKMGLKLSYSDAEVRQIMSMAHDAVINGKGRDVRANGFTQSKAYQPTDLGAQEPEASPLKYMFTGPKAKTYDLHMQDEAQHRLDDGADPNETRKYTGVHWASDGKPRMEISDDQASLIDHSETGQPKLRTPGTYALEEVLHHPRLFEAYPELRDMTIDSHKLEPGWQGAYLPREKSIVVSPTARELHSTVLHEVQHAVQHIEGNIKADGGTASLSADDYRDNALEKEARSTEARAEMSGYERATSDMPKFMHRSDLKTKAFTALADAQRDKPERAMLEAQRAVSEYPSGNTYGTLLEHVGDLTHRMSEPYAQQAVDHGQEYVKPKVVNAIRILGNPVDVDRLNRGKPWIEDSVQQYAEEHAKLPTYNLVQRLGRDAAVKLGQGDLQGSLRELKNLKQIIDSGRYPEEAAKYDPQSNRFMRRSDLAPKDVAEEAYDRLNASYTPTKRTWEQTAELAKNTALSPEMVRSTRGVGNLDRKLFVYDAAAKEANEKLMALKADGPMTAEQHADALETMAHFNYVLGRIENDAAQIARGLNAMKAVRFSRNNLLALKKALEDGDTNMDALTDPDTMLKFLKQYQKLAAGNNPNGAANMLKSVTQPYWWQYLLSFRQNMMLSALSTHLKSTMDMATMAGRDIEEKLLAMPGAAVREGMRSLGLNVKPGLHPTEFAAHMSGLAESALEAKTYMDTLQAAKTGTPAQYTQWANGGIQQPRIPFVSKVSDLVSAQDTFFRSFLMNANLKEIGTRAAYNDMKARGGTVKWDDAMIDGSARARNPTPEMIAEARELTENTILLNKSPMNAAIDKARAIKPGMTGYEQLGSFFTNLLTPFIRVGSNALMNQIIRRSPLAFLDPVTRADFKAGGARTDIAVARIALGTTLIGMYWNAADPKKNQLIGEGPDNHSKLMELEAGGFAPNSIHENGRYNVTSNLNISINPFDKHNNIATMVAGLRGAYEKGAVAKNVSTGLKLASVALLHSLANQSFINDLGEAMDEFTDRRDTTGQKIAKFAGDTAKSFLPNATNQLARIADPNKHDVSSDTMTGTVANTIQAAVPGMTGNLPIKYNVYGQPMKTGTDILGVHNWVTHGNGQNETTDPTERELTRLAGLTKAAIVTPTQRTVKVNGASVKLTPEQSEEYQKYAGQTIVQAVREQMQSGAWQQLSEQDRVNYVRSVQTQAKKEVRETLLQQPGWLNSDQISNLRSQLGGTQ